MTKAVTLRSHDTLPDSEQRRRRATTGLPNVGVDARVLDSGDMEVPWDGVTTGEICVRSNHVMAGYWHQPAETAEALRGGWLRTGDIATVDGEGYITIVDRRKDIIVSGGENVSSVEVEQVLSGHPAVLEVAVVGMADDRWGEVPRAFVVLRDGAVPVTPDQLIEWTRRASPTSRHPSGSRSSRSFPRAAPARSRSCGSRNDRPSHGLAWPSHGLARSGDLSRPRPSPSMRP